MASNAPTSSVAPVVAATTPADQPSKAPTEADDGDESEWEYEYSTTETEIYYLTVDLSIPQLLRRKRNAPVSGRGGYHYKHWAGPHRKPDEPKHHRILSEDENDDEPTAEPEEDEDMDQGQIEPNTDGFDADFESDPAADIQILDLHSDKPMFAYKGKIFEGQWSRNLGTEVIFTEHDAQDPLPALRHLPGGVDMLAASWSRINTVERRLEPKHEAAAKDDPLKEIRRQHGIHIPITADKTGERKRQTRFLENLMALKVKKGEKDEVTVYAHAAPKPVNEGANSRRKRRKPLPDSQSKKRRGRGGGVRGRGGPLAMEVGFESKAEPGDSADAATPRDGTLSTPTPTTWADLSGQGETADTVAGPNDEDDGSEDDTDDYEDGGDLE
ncbi:hypothetical protein LZ32DRAFT_613055 [Colletotrichum eremochloae]|nr:hypothetical protein LZ32DRAFT_613055 [Colletotrichum eremochloae]